MTDWNRPDRQQDDARPASPDVPPAIYTKGDVLHPEWGERPPWFGYIGVGIALAAMLIGIALMILVGTFAWRWIGR